MDEYEVRNRHGDVVQRGDVEIADIHEIGPVTVVELEFDEPAQLRRGDTLHSLVDLSDAL